MNHSVDNIASSDLFLQAFAHYMQSGNSDALMPFLAKQTSASSALLSIYRNGFFKGAISALQSNFPSINKQLPEAHFFAYVAQHPPNTASLVGYGFHSDDDDDDDGDGHSDDGNQGPSYTTTPLPFLQYLKNQPNIKHTAWLYELGFLDEIWLKTLNATNTPKPVSTQHWQAHIPKEKQSQHQAKNQRQALNAILTITDLQQAIEQGIDIATVPMALVPSTRVISLHYDVFSSWQTSRFSTEQSNLHSNIQPMASPMESPKHLVFWQQQNQVQVKIIPTAQKHFLNTLNATHSLAKAEQAAKAIDSQFDVSVLFAELLNGQLLQAMPKP